MHIGLFTPPPPRASPARAYFGSRNTSLVLRHMGESRGIKTPHRDRWNRTVERECIASGSATPPAVSAVPTTVAKLINAKSLSIIREPSGPPARQTYRTEPTHGVAMVRDYTSHWCTEFGISALQRTMASTNASTLCVSRTQRCARVTSLTHACSATPPY